MSGSVETNSGAGTSNPKLKTPNLGFEVPDPEFPQTGFATIARRAP